MGFFDRFREGRIDKTQPAELSVEDLLEELSLYRDSYVSRYNHGIDDNPDPVGIETYNKMRKTDAQCRAGLLALRLPILAKGYVFKRPLQDLDVEKMDEYDKQIEFLNYAFKNMEHSFDETLDQMLSAIWAGFSVTEPVFIRYKEGKWKGKIGLKKAKVLNPVSIKFRQNDYGDVVEVIQEIGSKTIRIPKDKVIIYSFDAEFGNPYGSSALHAVHNHWYIKNYIYKFANMAYERNGSPLLVGKVTNKNEVSKMRAVLDNILGRTGVAISGTEDIKVLDTTKSMDFVAYINHHNMMILRGLMIPSLLFGNEGSGTGSYALGQSHFDMYLFRLQSIQRQLEKVINEKIIKKLIDINFGKQEVYPEMKFAPLQDKDRDKLSDIFFKLVNAQILEPTEDWIRDELGFPVMDKEHKDRVKKEAELKLQRLEHDVENSKNPAPSDDEEGARGNPTSKGTKDSGSHPLNSKGRGNLDKTEGK